MSTLIRLPRHPATAGVLRGEISKWAGEWVETPEGCECDPDEKHDYRCELFDSVVDDA